MEADANSFYPPDSWDIPANTPDGDGYTNGAAKSVSPECREMRCLTKFLDDHLVPRMKYVTDMHCMSIYYEDLWFLFHPGDDVAGLFADGPSTDIQVYRIVSVCGLTHHQPSNSTTLTRRQFLPFKIEMVYIDSDGRSLGPVLAVQEIQYFWGERPLHWLPVVPLNRLRIKEFRHYYDPQRKITLPIYSSDDEVRQALADRGKLYLALTEVMQMHFNGVTGLNEDLDCAVIVDLQDWFENYDPSNPYGKDPHWTNLVDWEADIGPTGKCACCHGSNVLSDWWVDRDRSQAYVSGLLPRIPSKLPPVILSTRILQQVDTKDDPFPEKDFLLLPPRVVCFVPQLRDYRWLPVNRLTPIGSLRKHPAGAEDKSQNDGRAFDQLVLPDGHKEMVKSLIVQHLRDKADTSVTDDQWDLIRGKGKGLIILLHGAPGVGKTTTAECVAEFFKKPLYQLTCGDLGMWPDEVESTLQEFSPKRNDGAVSSFLMKQMFSWQRDPRLICRATVWYQSF
ncbi:hypothetical protein F5Y17DRAFT_350577 [Xylariaceae sp. FL0594]|nr:hypothetical protein F5Y17DRAFT_350577 [Xylariaceae sp. FL0594]